MSSILKTKNHKASKPSSLIHFTSGISYGVDVLRGRTRKLRNTSKVLTTSRFDSTIISITSTTTTTISSNSFGSNPPLSHRPSIANADSMVPPNHFNAFVSQTSANPNERPTSRDPGTEIHSREIPLDLTPFSQDSIPVICVNEVQVDSEVKPLMEGITYKAVSIFNRNLGMMEGTKYLDIPATTTPPDSPAAIQEGGFGSLMGVSMAIMQGST